MDFACACSKACACVALRCVVAPPIGSARAILDAAACPARADGSWKGAGRERAPVVVDSDLARLQHVYVLPDDLVRSPGRRRQNPGRERTAGARAAWARSDHGACRIGGRALCGSPLPATQTGGSPGAPLRPHFRHRFGACDHDGWPARAAALPPKS
eukprot:gene12599-biopygen2623